MLEPPRLAICLLIALALAASGCGSTEKAASTSASTSTPNQPSTPTASQGTGSTGAQHTTSKAREQTAAQATPKHQELSAEAKRHLAEVKERIKQQVAKRVAEARRELEKKPLEAAANTVPLKKQYSVREQFKFVTLCKAAKGSHLDCECVLVKQELLNVETGESLAELLALEYALQQVVSLQEAVHGVPFPGGGTRRVRLPRRIRRTVEECVSTRK